ncbi:hypothetical protein HDU93_009367 [Gonapodya sp. JEL0774]|nr:hypothetical protein HDU93_009367 [Gonapodya sp. JEL0774]
MLATARVLQGISQAAVKTLGLALLGDLYPDAELGKAYGFTSLGFAVGEFVYVHTHYRAAFKSIDTHIYNLEGILIGLPLGGTLYATAGYWSPFLLSAAFMLCDLVARLLVVEPKRHSLPNAKSRDSAGASEPLPALRTNNTAAVSAPPSQLFPRNITWHVLLTNDPTYWDLVKDPAIMSLCCVNCIAAILVNAPEATVPLYLEKEYDASSVKISLMFFAMVAGGIVAAPLAGSLRDKYGALWVVIACFLGTAIGVPFWAVAKSYATVSVVVP